MTNDAVPHTIGHAAWPDRDGTTASAGPVGLPVGAAEPVYPITSAAADQTVAPRRPSATRWALALAGGALAGWWIADRGRQPRIDARTRARLARPDAAALRAA